TTLFRSPGRNTAVHRPWASVVRPAELPVVGQHFAGLLAQHVTADLDSPAFEFADPVGRQRAFVELGQGLHVLAAGTDQQVVDAGPETGAVALAARLRRGRQGHRAEAVAGVVLVEPAALGPLLGQHE